METPQQMLEPDICVTHPLMAFKILRNFGQLIPNLHVQCYLFYAIEKNLGPMTMKTIENYLAEYCSDSLVDLSLEDSCYTLFEGMEKPFTFLKTLHIDLCVLGEQLPFNKLFPNLQNLKLGFNRYKNPAAIRSHFPSLKNLWFYDGNDITSDSKFQKEDIDELLKLNPQLEKSALAFLDEYSPDFIRHIKKHYPNAQIANGFRRRTTNPFSYDACMYGDNDFYWCHIKYIIYPAHFSDKYIDSLEKLKKMHKYQNFHRRN